MGGALDREEGGPAGLCWSLEMAESDLELSVTAVGSSAQLIKAICLTLRPASRWVEVTECLSSSVGVQVLDGGGVREPLAFRRDHFGARGSIRSASYPSTVTLSGSICCVPRFWSPRAPTLV